MTIEEESGELKTYQILGEDEIEAQKGKISWKSPMAKALLNREEGDEVEIKGGQGPRWVEITKIQFV